jgi:hypothetical protein
VDVSSVPRGVHAERERAAGGVHGHVANAAVEPGEVRGIGPERGHVTFQRAAASRALPPPPSGSIADEAVQPVAVADDLEEEREHLLGHALGLLYAATRGGHAVVDGALLLLQEHYLGGHQGKSSSTRKAGGAASFGLSLL